MGGPFIYKKQAWQCEQNLLPALENLLWPGGGEDAIYSDPILKLCFWRRHIDDTLFIWRGDVDSFHNLICLNSNKWGIRFIYEWNKLEIIFLDLVIFRNYINERWQWVHSYRELHHPSWLKAVPKRQFQGIRRNCTEMQPGQLLENKDFFLPKEYQDDVLEQE